MLLTILLVPAIAMLIRLVAAFAMGEVRPADAPYVLLYGLPAPVLLVAAVRAWRGRTLRCDLSGEVRDLRERPERAPFGPENEDWVVLSFRLERFDDAGNRLPPVPVELRGIRFTGALSEGDWVDVESRSQHEGVHRVDEVYDVTTRTVVTAVGRSPGTKVALTLNWIIGLSLTLGFVVLVVLVFLVAK